MGPIKYTCGACDNTWTGLLRVHCSQCHSTFGVIKLFDLHRKDVRGNGTCLKPESIKNKNGKLVMFLSDGIWLSIYRAGD